MLRKPRKMGPIGLDIGSTSLKLIQLVDHDGQPALQAAAYVPLRHQDDPLTREAAMRRGLAEALHAYPFHGRDVVCGLGHGEFQMKSIRLPKMPAEDLAAAAKFESKDRFDFQGSAAQFRHLPAGEVRHGNELKEEVMVFAASDDLITDRIALLESCRLRPTAIELAPAAMARSFMRFLRRAEDQQAVNVFVDVGWRGTALVITRGTELAFLKMLDIGGRHFADAAASALKVSFAEASELRLNLLRQRGGRRSDSIDSPSGDLAGTGGCAVAPHEITDELLAAAIDAARPLAEQIAKDLQMCLRYYAVTFRGQRPEIITLVGGEAHEPALAAVLSEALDMPCLVGYPLRGVLQTGPVVAALCGNPASAAPAPKRGHSRSFMPAWAVACGLALRGSPWCERNGHGGQSFRREPSEKIHQHDAAGIAVAPDRKEIATPA